MPRHGLRASFTEDGFVTDMSDREEPHPLYGVPSRLVEVTVPITPEERALASIPGGFIDTSVRSFCAQLGGVADHASSTAFHIGADSITLSTHLGAVHDAEVLFRGLRMAMTEGRVRLLRLFLAHPESALTAPDVKDALEQKQCRFPSATVDGDGTIHLPLASDVHYSIDSSRLTPRTVADMFRGQSGRGALRAFREEKPGLPPHVPSGAFFLGAVDVDVGPFACVLQGQTRRSGLPTHLYQLPSHFDPLRTVGRRQIELKNMNGQPEALPVEIVCRLHRTS